MSEGTAAPVGGEDAAAAQVDDAAPDDQIGEDEIADLEGVEVITTAVGEDGTVVIDDLVAEVDASGHVVATDERIEIDLPDGTVIVDETFSVMDESGELVEIEEDTTIISPIED